MRCTDDGVGVDAATGDDPYAFAHVRDEPVTAAHRAALGIVDTGTRVTVPLPDARPPAIGRLRTLVAQLVQLRPVLEDPARELWLELPGQPLQLVTYPPPIPIHSALCWPTRRST